jgi:FixJ family two-component response regulator
MLSFSYVAAPALISVVDDDESVREALCRLLRSIGFAVRAFASPKSTQVRINLKIRIACSSTCGCRGGVRIELQRQLNAGHSKIPVIFITAYADEAYAHKQQPITREMY